MSGPYITLEFFDIMLDIAETNDIAHKDWAAAAWGNSAYASRISELKSISRLKKNQKTGRRFSSEKCFKLLAGLETLVEKKKLRAEIRTRIKQIPDPRGQIHLLVNSAPDQAIKEILPVLLALHAR